MKKIIFTAVCVAIVKSGISQVTIQPTIASAGLVHKEQLWNVIILNTKAASYDCMLKLVVTDRNSGAELFTASSSSLHITTGAKQVNINSAGPVQYNYLSGGQSNYFQGLIPAGSYTACYVLTSISAKEGDIAEQCINFDAEPLSPPNLSFPADSSVVHTSPAQFSWIPPSPSGMFDRLQYEILIAEINEGQSAPEALQENIPFYSEGNISGNGINYAASAKNFEKEKWYAWQVTARDKNNYAGKSEVWVFKISESEKTDPSGGVYLLLDNEHKGTYRIIDNVLRLKYFSHSKDHTGSLVFTDNKGKEIKKIIQKIKQGENYFEYQLPNRFRSGEIYSVTITDEENKRNSITFRIN